MVKLLLFMVMIMLLLVLCCEYQTCLLAEICHTDLAFANQCFKSCELEGNDLNTKLLICISLCISSVNWLETWHAITKANGEVTFCVFILNLGSIVFL